MDFRTRVKEICKKQGIMQKDLAERLGITAIGLSQTLGQEYPQLQTLERIAKALNIQVVDLFDRPTDGEATGTCPHCGRPIKIKLEE